jgi:hypothetical protein
MQHIITGDALQAMPLATKASGVASRAMMMTEA